MLIKQFAIILDAAFYKQNACVKYDGNPMGLRVTHCSRCSCVVSSLSCRYEDYLDNQITATDMFYLEDVELARQLVELGWVRVLHTADPFKASFMLQCIRFSFHIHHQLSSKCPYLPNNFLYPYCTQLTHLRPFSCCSALDFPSTSIISHLQHVLTSPTMIVSVMHVKHKKNRHLLREHIRPPSSESKARLSNSMLNAPSDP